MSRLTDWLFAIHENGRLRKEVAFLSEKIEDLAAELKAERSESRNREVHLVDAIADLAEVRLTPASRDTTTKSFDEKPQILIGADTLTADEIDEIANDFQQNAEASGKPYTEDERNALIAHIKANPGEYLR